MRKFQCKFCALCCDSHNLHSLFFLAFSGHSISITLQIFLKYLYKTYSSCKYSNCNVFWYEIFPVWTTPLVMFDINLPYHYAYISSCSVPKCCSCSIRERTARRATLLTTSSGREWNIRISYGHWSDCGKGFGLVCTAK